MDFGVLYKSRADLVRGFILVGKIDNSIITLASIEQRRERTHELFKEI